MSQPEKACFVADDHPAMLEAVCEVLLEHGWDVVGRARDGAGALEGIERLQPAVAIVDVRMPRISGIELARRLQQAAVATGVVLYTAYGDRMLITEAIDAGARGFVLKEAPLADLVRAVDTVAAGGTYIDPVLAAVLATAPGPGAVLSQREREVLRFLADGLSNEEIGKKLFISPDTVRTHIGNAMRKLEADTRTQAVAIALRQSLIG